MKAIMFDMDGTLIDSIGGWFNSYKYFLKDNNLEETEELKELLKGYKLFKRGIIVNDYFKLGLSANDMYVKNLFYVKKGYDQDFQLKEGVKESLEYLKNKRYKISLNTATNLGLCENCLKRLDILKYFDYIQTCDSCGFMKDDVRFYEFAIKEHGEKAEDIVFFDDTFTPLDTAKKLGIKTALVYDENTSGEDFETANGYNHKFEIISVENLKKIGL